MNVFIVRPFGRKPIASQQEKFINFDEVQEKLIDPVLKETHLTGGTTAEITEAGNIRTDMFQKLLTADLVIADISIHNANVYYELGIRHALRPRATILIRCAGDEIPFDLKTDRYLEYDSGNLEGDRPKLRQVVERTLDGYDRIDSPVFLMLPQLKEQDSSILIKVPLDFQEVVENSDDLGILGLLAIESEGTEWYREGLRLVGRKQLAMRAWEAAHRTWEKVRAEKPDDVEANLNLGTICERLGKLTQSTQRLQQVLNLNHLECKDRVEALALLARNQKRRWSESWENLPEDQWRKKAFNVDLLQEIINSYVQAFSLDLNNYYPGLNALSGLTLLINLAALEPEAWHNSWDDDAEARQQLIKYTKQRDEIAGTVRLSLEAAQRKNEPDSWMAFSLADYAFLTAKRPQVVADRYAAAKNKSSSSFNLEAVTRQIKIFEKLGILEKNTQAALEVLDEGQKVPPLVTTRDRIIVSTGHRVDHLERKTPRFPNDSQSITKARQAIREKVDVERENTTGTLQGIAGGANGSDILFHEACQELVIPTTVFLAIPKGGYMVKSVNDGGEEWTERFNQLCHQTPLQVLSDSPHLPSWVKHRPHYNVFQRGNIWMLESALSQSDTDVTLIAFWDGHEGDGPGGTSDMVRLAREQGAKVVMINTRSLFGLA